jgi:hypothetical protein
MAIGVRDTTLFAGSPNSVFVSTDKGASWSPAMAGFPSSGVSSLTPSGSTIFAGTGTGVYALGKNETSWRDVSIGLPDVRTGALRASGTNLLVGTLTAGVWKRPLSEMVTSAPGRKDEIPVACLLRQNYPNPFNPTTIISFELPAAGHVKLAVYDLLGCEVAMLADGVYPPGTHELTFDGRDLASGVYVYRLKAGSSASSRKMILLR